MRGLPLLPLRKAAGKAYLNRTVPRRARAANVSPFWRGRLQNSALAFGQALDAIGGDFVENGIDFAADELCGGQIVNFACL